MRNAVLILHGTGGSGAQFIRAEFAGELFGAGRLLDATRYFIILPDNIGHGRSEQAQRRAARKVSALRLQRHGRRAVPPAHRRPGRQPPAAGDGHVDGRHAHLAVGRALSGFHGRADAARQPADADLRPQPRLAPDRHRRDSQRSGLAGRRLHGAAAEPAHRGADALLHGQQSGPAAGADADAREDRRRCSTQFVASGREDAATPTTCSTSSSASRGLRPGPRPGEDPRAACSRSTPPTT